MIISFTGYKGSGKDKAADYLVDKYGFKKYSFADKLREVCSDVLNIPMEYFIDRKMKETVIPKFNMTPRQILVEVGTGCFRKIYAPVWCEYVINQIGDEHATISDVRFIDEYQAVKDAGGVVVRINRDGCELGDDVKSAGLYDYDVDVIDIDNNGTLEDLYKKIDKIVRNIK